jgi:hypothetical protein
MLLEEFVRLARALALVIAALLLLAHAAAAQGMEPPTVVDAFARARVAQDVDATMAEFADDAVVRVDHVRPRIMNGKKEIRELFDELSIEAPTLLAQPRSTATDTLTWSERVLEAHYGTIDLTGQAQVENGKIVTLVYRLGRLPDEDSAPVSGASNVSRVLSSSTMMTGAVGLFALGLFSFATVRSRRASGSRLSGRMLAEMRHWSGSSHTLR